MVRRTNFSADVDDWIRKSKRRIDAVVKYSAKDVFGLAQKPVADGGNMPVDTGFLRASLLMTLNGGTALSPGPLAYELAVNQMEVGDVLKGTWTANYARHVEYGAQGRAGRRFVGLAAAQWQAIVRRNVARVKREMP